MFSKKKNHWSGGWGWSVLELEKKMCPKENMNTRAGEKENLYKLLLDRESSPSSSSVPLFLLVPSLSSYHFLSHYTHTYTYRTTSIKTMKKSIKKSTTVLIATTLAITILAGGLVDAKPKNLHKADISHPKGTSPWPKYGEKPETNTPEVKAWVKTVNWANVPKLPIRHTESPGDPPDCPKKDPPKSDCWWTCHGCFADDDVVDCPGKNHWGLTFDDGPEPGVTENLFKLLHEKNVTATFFVTGMKSTKAPWLLKETIDRGHHLASHSTRIYLYLVGSSHK